MNVVKRVLALSLCLALTVGGLPARAAGGVETASPWAREGVRSAIDKGFVPYYSYEDNYKAVITRGEFCLLAMSYLYYVMGQSQEQILAERGVTLNENAFSDTQDPYVLAAYALGITSGTVAPTEAVPGRFDPNGQFSREQAATMILNLCKVFGADVADIPAGKGDCVDLDSASGWAREAIHFCLSSGIMSGTSTTPLLFSPKATFTREQSIVTLNNIEKTDVIKKAGIVMAPGLLHTQVWDVTRWANVSPVQQFAYMDEGLAYAYLLDGTLHLTTPEKTMLLEAEYPLLGDVIADDAGNFYVVWGKENEGYEPEETVFITKYDTDGQRVKTTGFVGEASPWGGDDAANTRIPFDAGNCVSVIANGILMNYHSKERYDGHQSDIAVAVKISDMSPYALPHNTYSGHSFNQSLIYCEKTSDFLFASHGDAYARGMRVGGKNGDYADGNEVLFHCYLESNAAYDMGKVNVTFAQLGGLAETSKGVALVGASAKSIGEAAKGEKQNLFVQIFDPRAHRVSANMFVGGTTRSGATAFDINDTSNAPLTPVTDYGVRWLTDYTDKDVVAPQVVTADDRLVILWSTMDDTYYMVLSADGEVLAPQTSLGDQPLNSYERPIYHNGAIYWASSQGERIRIRSLSL